MSSLLNYLIQKVTTLIFAVIAFLVLPSHAISYVEATQIGFCVPYCGIVRNKTPRVYLVIQIVLTHLSALL